MLVRLRVKNIAVVEEAEVGFDGAFNAITGETGAGKSVLMGALDLVLGGRADASVVRDGAREAEVEAEFALPDGARRIVRRTVTAEGRSRAWLDEESVTVAELREFGAQTVDIHGPRANQKLVEEGFQRAELDRYAGDGRELAAYAKSYAAYFSLVDELAALSSGGAADEDALDLLRYQIGELEGAALSDDDETVAERHAAAAHAEEIVANANAVTEGLGGDQGVAELLVAQQPKFRAMSKHLACAAEWAEKCEELTLEAQELSRAVADAVSKLDAGEESLEELDARLTLVNRLKRKYLKPSEAAAGGGSDIRRLLATLDEKRRRLDDFEHREERIAGLKAKVADALKAVKADGARLTKARRAAAAKIAKAVTEELRELGFRQAEFAVELEAAEPAAHGCDRVVYVFGPNPGEPARPLSDIASSGEIARVMLALKIIQTSNVKPQTSNLQTLVFDEIDANVGGEVGCIVGEKLRRLGRSHQVVAITHLPQSAAFADRQLAVSKRVDGGRTRTSIVPVEGEERVREIARMLGGEKLTSVVRRHAEELLQLKESGKRNR